MDPLVVSLAVMCSIGLGGVALSFAAFLQASSSSRIVERRSKSKYQELETAFEEAKETVSSLEEKVQKIEENTSPPLSTPGPRPGFNLSTRSQALRMHRRGANSNQIAAALQIPIQEVELLLKVHLIVLNNLIVEPKPEATLQHCDSA